VVSDIPFVRSLVIVVEDRHDFVRQCGVTLSRNEYKKQELLHNKIAEHRTSVEQNEYYVYEIDSGQKVIDELCNIAKDHLDILTDVCNVFCLFHPFVQFVYYIKEERYEHVAELVHKYEQYYTYHKGNDRHKELFVSDFSLQIELRINKHKQNERNKCK
jgi:hypothetical protein